MELTLDICALSNDGRGIAARTPGEKVVFVARALPGERVLARLTGERKGFREAEAIEVLTPSEHAVTPPCPHADVCGGCPLMRLDYARQLFWKERFVHDALTRIGHVAEPPMQAIVPSPGTLGYRNRLELAFGLDGEGRVRLGMRRRLSHSVVPTPSCRLVPERAWPVLASLERLVGESGLGVFDVTALSAGQRQRSHKQARRKTDTPAGFLRFCQLRFGRIPDERALADARHVPEREGLWLILLTSPGSRRERDAVRGLATELLQEHPALHAVLHEERSACDLLVRGEQRRLALSRDVHDPDPALMIMPLLDAGYLTDAADFFQVNGRAADLLAARALECSGGGRADPHPAARGPLLDLYCGVGSPGLSLADGPVLGVEYSATAVATARRNALRFGLEGHYEAGDAARVLARHPFRQSRPAHILCDPPRAGMERAVLDFLVHRQAERLVYISCNPATLARDLRELSACYELRSVTPLDLFPHTPHVETVALLAGKGRD